MTLDQLPLRQAAIVESVDWAAIGDVDAKRLRYLGLEEGVRVEPLHAGAFGGDPLAIAIGRMSVALRRSHARAVTVELGA